MHKSPPCIRTGGLKNHKFLPHWSRYGDLISWPLIPGLDYHYICQKMEITHTFSASAISHSVIGSRDPHSIQDAIWFSVKRYSSAALLTSTRPLMTRRAALSNISFSRSEGCNKMYILYDIEWSQRAIGNFFSCRMKQRWILDLIWNLPTLNFWHGYLNALS